MPPVAAPERMGFQASSLWRTATREQSQTENRAPQTAKFPPRTGARYWRGCCCLLLSLGMVLLVFRHRYCIPGTQNEKS